MSSIYVRDQFKTFLTANIGVEKLVDLSLEYREMDELLTDYGIASMEPWTAVDFIGNDEEPISLPATNTTGRYRETGAVYIHIVGVAMLGGADTILSRAEALRTKLRGQRLGRVIIESVSPPNSAAGSTLQFERGFMSYTFICGYEADIDL